MPSGVQGTAARVTTDLFVRVEICSSNSTEKIAPCVEVFHAQEMSLVVVKERELSASSSPKMQGESAGGVNFEGCHKIRGQVKENDLISEVLPLITLCECRI